MINVLQIIVHLPLLSTPFPYMTQFVFSLIVQVSQFNILPISFLNQNVISFSDPNSQLNSPAFNNLDIFLQKSPKVTFNDPIHHTI